MPQQKHFHCKLYDQDGTTLITTYSTRRPESAATGYLKQPPAFESRINGGYGELVLDLALPFDDFGEGTTIDYMHVVKVYAITVDSSLAQTETLIYTGFVSRYEPYLEADGSEGVRVTCLGLISLLSLSFYKDGTSYTVAHTGDDPEDIGRAIIDHFNTVFGGSLLSYSDATTDAVGTTVTVTFTDQKWADALKRTGDLTGTGWWWKIDESGLYHLKEKPSSATHTFTVKKDVTRLVVTKDSEGVVNDVQVRRSGGTTSNYDDSTSQATFGTGSPATGKRSQVVSESGIGDSGTADQRGDKLVEDNKNAKVKATVVVNTNYPIESVKVGETCNVRNTASAVVPDNALIVAVRYEPDQITVELEGRAADLGATLAEFVNG